MTPRQIFNLIVVIILVAAALGINLIGLAGLAQAAPAAGTETILPTLAPAYLPLLDGEPVLTVTKSSINEGGNPLRPGERITYTIVISNSGDVPATNVVISDTFPANTTFVPGSIEISPLSAGGSPGTQPTLAEGISITDASLVTITYAVTLNSTVADGTQIENTASVTSFEISTPVVGTVTDSVVNEADLAISKTNNQASTIPGQAVTYVIAVSNSGPSNAPNAVVSDTFPSPAISGINWTCAGANGATCPISGSGNINSTINLPVGGLVTFTATGTVSASITGSLINTATVTTPAGVTDPATANNSDTDTDTLTPQANLAISKTNNQTSTIPGQAVTYIIAVSNSGPSTASNAVVSDTFPSMSGVTWTCAETNGADCPASGSGNLNATVDLPVGGLVTFTATGTVSASVTGSLINTATVITSAGVTDPTPGNNSATDSDTLTPRANLAITKTDGKTSLIPGNSNTYTIVVSNSGPSNAPNTVVTDTFPSMSGVTWTCNGAGGGTCPASGSGNLNATVNLPAGGSVTFTAGGTVSASVTGSLINTATLIPPAGVTDSTPGNNSATDTDTLTPQADLSITKTDGKTSLIPGNSNTYTIVVANSGPSNAPVVTVTDSFPSMSGVTWTCNGAGGGTCPASGSGSLNQPVNVPSGGSVTFSAGGTVDPGARGSLTNTATLALPASVTDPNTTNNTATDVDTLNPQANLVLTKSDSSNTVSAGDLLTYTINIVNQEPSNRTQVQLTDNLPTAVTFLSSTPGSPTCNPNGASIVCDLDTIAGGSSVSVTIRVRVKSSTPAGSIINTALVEGNEADLNEGDDGGDNSDNESTTIQVRPDLTISKTESADPIGLGAPLTYTLRITNNGLSDAPGVVVTDTLPGGVTFGSASSSRGSCSGTSTIICSLGSMTSGVTATVTIAVTPLSTGVFSNSASVGVTGSGVVDPNLGNNTTPVITTTVSQISDLAISASDSPDPVTEGNNLTYTLRITNSGPSTASGVTISNTLPAGVTFQSVTPSGPTCNHSSGVVTCNMGSMVKNSSATVSIVVKVNASTIGNISNTASVAVSGSTDPSPGNNSSTITTLVKGLQMVYLPITLKPGPTQLSVFNDHTNGVVTFTVLGTGVSCTVPNNTTQACGSFPPGDYNIQVTSACGSATILKSYTSGPQTTRVFCN